MDIQIKGRVYKLSPRYAFDVLELAEVTKDMDSSSLSSGFATAAKILSDSLKATYKSLPWYKRFRYRRFSGGGNLQFLLESLSERGLREAVEAILELEGVKKKQQREPVRSEEVSPGGSSRSSTASDSKK